MRIRWIWLGIALIVIVVYTFLYKFLEDWDWVQCFYASSMLTTLTGLNPPKNPVTKLFMVSQTMITFALISGALIVLDEKT